MCAARALRIKDKEDIMKSKLGLRTALPAVVLAFVLVLTLSFACTSATASAEDAISANPASAVTIGHVSDIHYFPAEYCYDSSRADYTESDFYHSTTGDTKLVIESGDIGMAHIEEFIEDARNGVAPEYLVATGDLSKNGEHAALIDVANALRYLQNSVRALGGKYADFQVLVVQGNHDLYNGSGKLYDPDDGSEYQAEVVTSAQFMLIFAGLGYPDMSYEELCEIYPAEYWSSSATEAFAKDTAGYVESTTAENLDITYFDAHVGNIATNGFNYSDYTALFDGSNRNVLSYYAETDGDFAFFMLDGTEREVTDASVPVRINENEYGYLSSSGTAFHLPAEDGRISSAAADADEVRAAFENGEPVYIDTGWNHITGGRLSDALLDWMKGLTAEKPELTYVAAYHFNALPHFEQEDDILKDFTFYNWEYIAKSFLEMGVRYGLSGHMHASDVAYYTDAAGRTFYDIETGSTVSYASPVRYITLTRYALADGKAGEQFSSSLHILDDIYGENYNEYITEHLYGHLVDRIVDHFVTMSTIEDLDIAGLIPSVLASFGVDDFVNYLIDIIAYDLYPDDVYPDGKTYDNLMDYLKESVIAELVNLKFGQNGYEMTLSQMASFIMMAHAEGVEPTTEEIFGEFAPTGAMWDGNLNPSDSACRDAFIAAMRDFSDKCDNGELGRTLFGTLLDALYYDEDSILKTLFAYEFDLDKSGLSIIISKALVSIINNPANLSSLTSLLTTFNIDIDPAIIQSIENAVPEGLKNDITTDCFSLSKAMNTLWPVAKSVLGSMLGINLTGNTIFEGVDNLLSSYLTDSFYIGLSGIAKNIVVAFATDDEIDLADRNNPETSFVLVPHEGYASEYAVTLSYVSALPVADEYNAPTQDNGRLPSHLTANFLPSDDNGAKYALSFYTGEEIGAEVVLYDVDGNVVDTVKITEADLNASADATHRSVVKAGENGYVALSGGTYAQYIPLIDLGLLTVTHTETGYELVTEGSDGEEVTIWVEYGYADRNAAEANSVVYRNRWTVLFTGLEEGKEYTYAVRGVYEGGGVSKVFDLAENKGLENFTFSTLPGSDVTDFDFIAIADMQGMIQSMYEKSAAAIDAIQSATAGEYDFVLNAGDMADNGDNFNQWGWAINENLDFFANTATFATAGNHEDEGNILSVFYNYASLIPEQDTDTGLYYSFDYATAHVIVLNTNDADVTNGISQSQYDWLKSDLEENKDAKWIFVLMHKSLYSGGSHSYDGDVAAMRTQLVPLFYEYGVDIVFAGHDHTYTVTECLDGAGNPVERASNDGGVVTLNADGAGVMYVTLGTIGTKFYEYMSNPDIEGKFDSELSVLATLAEQTFAKISVRGDTLTFTGFGIAGDGTAHVIYNEPSDDMLLVKILVPIAAVILAAGIITTVVLVRKKKKPAPAANEE